jgi:hypothetical protein
MYTTNPNHSTLAGTKSLQREDGKDKFMTKGTRVIAFRPISYMHPKYGRCLVPEGARGRVTDIIGRADALGKYQTHYGKAVIVVWDKPKSP